MKIAEIKEMTTNDLVERVEAEILLKSNNYAGLLRV